eukprot:268041-Amphidinium_carterae.1
MDSYTLGTNIFSAPFILVPELRPFVTSLSGVPRVSSLGILWSAIGAEVMPRAEFSQAKVVHDIVGEDVRALVQFALEGGRRLGIVEAVSGFDENARSARESIGSAQQCTAAQL